MLINYDTEPWFSNVYDTMRGNGRLLRHLIQHCHSVILDGHLTYF